MKNISGIIKESFSAFFDIDGEVISMNGARKISFITLGRFFYTLTDYGIAAGLGAMIFWMNDYNFKGEYIYLATLAYDFLAAASFYWLSDITGCDITLGKSFRRVINVMHKKGFCGKVVAFILAVGISIKAIVWEGPEVICFLFKKEINNKIDIWLMLLFFSTIQASFGTWLYNTGYDLWEKYGSSYFQSDSGIWALFMGAIFFIFILLVVSSIREIMHLLNVIFKKTFKK